MEKENIQSLVKKLESHFHGYKANDCSLVHASGMKLFFNSSWNNKTTVSGVGGKHSHSIGCSFTKPIDKIARDIKKRLVSEYRDDFVQVKKDVAETKRFQAEELLKLEALAQACSGELRDAYWNSRSSINKYIDAGNLSIKQNYSSSYEFTIDLDFGQSLKLIKFLKGKIIQESA